jgi:hypothetical protein
VQAFWACASGRCRRADSNPQRVLCLTRPFKTSKAPRAESEELLGRWRRSRGIGDEIVIATKVGARLLAPAADFVRSDGSLTEMDGLSAKAIRESAERSMSRLGVGRLDLLPDALEPGIHCVRTQWIRGFKSFHRIQHART